MAFSKEKAFDRAERLAAKGQHDKAAREYQAIVDNDPKEIRAWLMLADCLVRCGDAPRAIERYLQVGGYYIQKKDHQKALAVYRQVLNLDATRVDVQLRVAGLNAELGRIPDAVAMYERVAGLQLQAGKTIDALQTYRVVADTDPTAVSRRLRLAELYSREERTAEAVEAFRQAGEQLLAQDRKSDYVRVAERLLFHDAADLPTVRKLAAVYLDLGDPRRALMKLNGLLHADAGDREGIELLAQTFMALGKPDKAVSAIGELARSLRESGSDAELAEAARVLRLGLAWAPGHRDLAAALAQVQGEDSIVEAAPEIELSEAAESGVMELDLDDSDVLELDDDDVLLEEDEASGPVEMSERHAPDAAAPPMTQSVLLEADDSGEGFIDGDSLTDFDKILFEARVYIKYRLFEHALDHVSVALSQQPEHVGALSLQARALTELGRTVDAADAHAHVARLVIERDPKLAREHIAAALNLAPGHVEALQVEEMLQRDDGPADEVSVETALLSESSRTELLTVDTSDDAPANLLDVDHSGRGEDEDFAIEVDLADEVEDSGELIRATRSVEVEDRFGLDGTGEDEERFADLTAEVSEHGERDLGGTPLLEPSVDTEGVALNDHALPRGSLQAPGRGAPVATEPDLVGLAIGKDRARALNKRLVAPRPKWPDISDDIAEVRFFMDQGLEQDAEAALAELRKRHQGHPALEALDVTEPSAPVSLDADAAAPLVSFDAEDDDEDAYLSAIFSDPAPKAEVPKPTGGARVASDDVDAQSAFDLGVAYREMGLVDQAVAQFEAASVDPAVRVRALVMLGTMRLQQGNADSAVASLEEAVQLAATEDEAAEANYELGVLYEKVGDTAKAIARLNAVMAGYRDRDKRLGALQS